MSNLKRWRKIGGSGSFQKWTEPGQSIEGIWQGQHDGKFGPNGTVKTSEGERTFPLHTALLNQTEDLAEGVEVKIIYEGKKMNSNTGREFKNFSVYIAAEDDPRQPGEEG